MAKRTTKGKPKRAKKAAGPKRTKAPTARASRAKKKSPAQKKKSSSVAAAATAVASTVMDRLRAWSPSRYTTR